MFHDIYVIPYYGKNQALLKWEVDPTLLEGNFIVQKSGNGITHWETIHSQIGITEYLDENFVIPNKTQQTFYRVIVQYNKNRFTSDSVATFDKLNKKEYGILHRMMQLEQYRMFNAQNGLEFVIFKQKIGGEPCECIDENTGQHLGSTLCPECFATGIKGGFDDPVKTLVETSKQQEKIDYDKEGRGAKDEDVRSFRVVAYPELRKGDLIINPRSDERFLVEQKKIFKFKGIVPFVYEFTGLHLRRNDIRYQLKAE